MRKRARRKGRRRAWRARWEQAGGFFGGRCPDCHGRLFYFDRYDAVCCPWCNQWIEGRCSDPSCEYCARRPETPEEALPPPGRMYEDKDACIRRYERREKSRRRQERRQARRRLGHD